MRSELDQRHEANYNNPDFAKRPGPSLKPIRPGFAVDVYAPSGAIAATFYSESDTESWEIARGWHLSAYPTEDYQHAYDREARRVTLWKRDPA